MAMVFKSKKETAETLQKDLKHPGPGDYLPQTIYKKLNKNKKFITTSRENFYPKNFNPGPGHYFQNEKIKIKKIELSSIKNSRSKIFFENKGEIYNESDNITETKLEEKLGFNTKAIRFKPSPDKTEQPGPGQYFPVINKFYKTSFINKIKEKYKPRKVNRNLNKYKLAPSIPSKEQKYGYIIEDENLIPKKAPNFNQTFTGIKGDTVGPGTYETDKNSELYKSRPKWTISKDFKNTMSLLSTNHSDNSRLLDNNNNNNLLSSITASRFYIDDNNKIKELSPYNISNNSFSSCSISYHLNKLNKSDNGELKNKNYIFKRMPLSYTINNFYKKDKGDFMGKKLSRLSFKINRNPGPGQYINQFKNSSFNCKSLPESQQFFGSNSRRFNYKEKSCDEKDIINTRDNSEEKKLKKNKVSTIPFSSSEKRFKPPNILIDKYLSPSPDLYFPTKIKKLKSFSNFMKFGSGAKRFAEKKNDRWLNEMPGPGTYNPEKIRGNIKTKKMVKTNDFNNTINKNDIYIDRLNYKIKTIEYENEKKAFSSNLKKIKLYKENPNLKKRIINKNINPPPGLYYVDKPYEFKQIISPFNSTANKQIVQPLSNILYVGPGQYKKDSYFDWNKKSFNISYI